MTLYNHFDPLPIGAVKPLGWLKDTLQRQVDGLSGILDKVPPRRGFKVNPVTGNSVWLGGSAGKDFIACRSERAPYYVRGLVCLAGVTNDTGLMDKAGNWLNYWFDNQGDDGRLRAKGVSDYEWWPRMLILDAVRFYFEASGDKRAISFMEKYCHFQKNNLPNHPLGKNLRYYPERLSWASLRGSDNMDSVAWLYQHTEDPGLISLTDILNEQTFPWEEKFITDNKLNTHAVNLAHGLRKPAIQHRLWRDDNHKMNMRTGIRKAHELHGQINGSISGDERTAGKGSDRGTELCTIVEMMRTYETLISVFGKPSYGDALERLAYNALPAAVAPDFLSHQYFSQPNQVYCTMGNHGFDANKIDLPGAAGWYKDALTFGAPAGYECCFYNFHMGWPLFTANMWMKYTDDGLAAVAYGPCEVSARIKGETVRIIEDTAYPFEELIVFTVKCRKPISFALLLRIPEWCAVGTATIGEEVFRGYRGSYLALRREWQNGEKVVLELPAEFRTVYADKGILSVERGALVFALNPEELWLSSGNSDHFPNYEVLPAEEKPVKNGSRWSFDNDPVWNYGLHKDTAFELRRKCYQKKDSDGTVDVKTGTDLFPWTPRNAPLRIRVELKRVPGWGRSEGFFKGLNAEALPRGGMTADNESKEVGLVPYGCARVRISMFPEILVNT